MNRPHDDSYRFRIKSWTLDEHGNSCRILVDRSSVSLPVGREYHSILLLHAQCMVWERSGMLVIWSGDDHVAVTCNPARGVRSIDLGVNARVYWPGITHAYSRDRRSQLVFIWNELRLDAFHLVELKHGCILVPNTSLRHAKSTRSRIPSGYSVRIYKHGLKTVSCYGAAIDLEHICQRDLPLE
jgi:hypothetical protein